MNRAFVPAARSLGPHGIRPMTGTERRRFRWVGAWRGALRIAGSFAHSLLRTRERQAERRRAVLAGIDAAGLSDAGRHARREALHAIRDAQRRAGRSGRAKR